jgi:hypothetical protein
LSPRWRRGGPRIHHRVATGKPHHLTVAVF